MRRSMFLLLVPLLIAGFTHDPRPRAAPWPQEALRYDGIYQSQEAERMQWGSGSVPIWSYLRFTPDGMVVYFTTTGRPNELGSFSAANTTLPIGSVTVLDSAVSFSVSNRDGVMVDFTGRILGDRLHLRTRSTNGYQADRVFAFVPIPAGKLRQWDRARPE